MLVCYGKGSRDVQFSGPNLPWSGSFVKDQESRFSFVKEERGRGT